MHKSLDEPNLLINCHIDNQHNILNYADYNQLHQYKKNLAFRNVALYIQAQDLIDMHHDPSTILHLNITRRASVSDSLLEPCPEKYKCLKRSKTTEEPKSLKIMVVNHNHIYYMDNTLLYNVFVIKKKDDKIYCIGEEDVKIKTTKLLKHHYHVKTVTLQHDYDIIYKDVKFIYPIYISCKEMTTKELIKNLQKLLNLIID